MNKSTTTTKQADIRFRVQLKNRPHIVVYKVMSSNGVDMYDVTLVNGKVNNCTCKSRKPCYHMTSVQAREDAREAEQVTSPVPPRRQVEAWTEEEEQRYNRPLETSQKGSLHSSQGFSLMR